MMMRISSYVHQTPKKVQYAQRCVLATMEWLSLNKHCAVLYGSYASNAYISRHFRKHTSDIDIAVGCSNHLEFAAICESYCMFLRERFGADAGLVTSHLATASNSITKERPPTLVVRCMGERRTDLTMMSMDVLMDCHAALVPWDSIGMTSLQHEEDQSVPCFLVNVISFERIILHCWEVSCDHSNYRRERDAFDLERFRLLSVFGLMFKKPVPPFFDVDRPSAGHSQSPTSRASDDSVSLSSVPSCSAVADTNIEQSAAASFPMSKCMLEICSAVSPITITQPEKPKLVIAHQMIPTTVQTTLAYSRTISRLAEDSKNVRQMCEMIPVALEHGMKIADTAIVRAEKEMRRMERSFVCAAKALTARQHEFAARQTERIRKIEHILHEAERAVSTEHMADAFHQVIGEMSCVGAFRGICDVFSLSGRIMSSQKSPYALADALSASMAACAMCISGAKPPAITNPAYAALPEGSMERVARRLASSPGESAISNDDLRILESSFIRCSLLTPGVVLPAGSAPQDNAWIAMRMICCASVCALDSSARHLRDLSSALRRDLAALQCPEDKKTDAVKHDIHRKRR